MAREQAATGPVSQAADPPTDNWSNLLNVKSSTMTAVRLSGPEAGGTRSAAMTALAMPVRRVTIDQNLVCKCVLRKLISVGRQRLFHREWHGKRPRHANSFLTQGLYGCMNYLPRE